MEIFTFLDAVNRVRARECFFFKTNSIPVREIAHTHMAHHSYGMDTVAAIVAYSVLSLLYACGIGVVVWGLVRLRRHTKPLEGIRENQFECKTYFFRVSGGGSDRALVKGNNCKWASA